LRIELIIAGAIGVVGNQLLYWTHILKLPGNRPGKRKNLSRHVSHYSLVYFYWRRSGLFCWYCR